jgi:hypothetical protein
MWRPLARLFRRRQPPEAGSPETESPDPRADELREKLAEARSVVDERDEFEAAETTVDQAEPALPSVEERRAEVHEAGRARVEQMQKP